MGAPLTPTRALIIVDGNNHLICRVTYPAGAVSTLAGTRGAAGTANGPAPSSTRRSPSPLTHGLIYISNYGNHAIRTLRCAPSVTAAVTPSQSG